MHAYVANMYCMSISALCVNVQAVAFTKEAVSDCVLLQNTN